MTQSNLISPWSPSKETFTSAIADLKGYRLDQLWNGLYDNNKSPEEIDVLPKKLRTQIADLYSPGLVNELEVVSDDKKTIKNLWKLNDGETIESVLMHYASRSTLCVSSQAGCAMGCTFCATGQAGYKRNLDVGEILEQVAQGRKTCELSDRRLSNIVFMGMGEPFSNFDVVVEAIERIMGDFKIGARHITVSTIGLIPQIIKFADLKLQVGLAISLHGANNDLRSSLAPVNNRYPLNDLAEACAYYFNATGRRVSFEWAMIADTNDATVDAEQLAAIAKKAKAHVNLIPLNPTPGFLTVGSSKDTINDFADELEDMGVNVTIRHNRGTEIDGACGQLKANYEATPVKIRKAETTS